jgi:hypothetical protein
VTLNDYRETYSWRAAVELGRSLTKLTEELPAHEDRGLIMALQSSMLDIPTTIADDLINSTKTRQTAYLRLESALELVERVYPALDTAESKSKLDELIERTESPSFTDVHQAPLPDPEPDDEDDAEPAATPVEVATESV